MLCRGELPTVRIGRALRIPTQAVHEWVERQVGAAHNGCHVGPGVRQQEVNVCHTDVKTVPFGGRRTPTQAAKELDVLLEQRTEGKQQL